VRVDIWSDLVCPWCYIGKRRFEKALAGLGRHDEVDVVHRAFQLDPTMPKGQLFRHRDVLMKKYGMTEPQVAAAQSLDAHRLVRLAREQGMQDAVIERFFRAHFTELRSLFDDESLLVLSEEAGLTDAGDVLASDRYAADVVADHREANGLGAHGVPFFVIDSRYGISGAQSVEVFASTLARALG
jgi:predicted DsbA family dithiol-disulfide isomerase